MTLKIDAKFDGKLTGALKNDMRNLANLYRGPTIKDVRIKRGRGVNQMQTSADRGRGVGEMRMSTF